MIDWGFSPNNSAANYIKYIRFYTLLYTTSHLINDYICVHSDLPMKSSEIATLEPKKNILIKGAQIHNLKSIDVVIPRNQ